jgi:hypothetical protein
MVALSPLLALLTISVLKRNLRLRLFIVRNAEKLIFMAEAVPARKQAGRMKIGQPFDVEVIGNE